MFERFTDRARRVLVLAQEEARTLNDPFIGVPYFLASLIREGESIAFQAMTAEGLKREDFLGAARDTPSPGSPPFTLDAKKSLEYALREALLLGHSYIGPEHVLLGILRMGSENERLAKLGVQPDDLRDVLFKCWGVSPAEPTSTFTYQIGQPLKVVTEPIADPTPEGPCACGAMNLATGINRIRGASDGHFEKHSRHKCVIRQFPDVTPIP